MLLSRGPRGIHMTTDNNTCASEMVISTYVHTTTSYSIQFSHLRFVFLLSTTLYSDSDWKSSTGLRKGIIGVQIVDQRNTKACNLRPEVRGYGMTGGLVA